MRFTKAIVRTPGKSLSGGLSSSNLGLPDYNLALIQHNEYIKALRSCGLDVTILESEENFPDSVFVEDVALCTAKGTILTRPGAKSRRGEVDMIRDSIQKNFSRIEHIKSPGSVEAGDIMMADNHFFIGLSERTNENGANQMISCLKDFGYSGSTVSMADMLHLKSGVSYLENNNILVCEKLKDNPSFRRFNKIIVENNEEYSANCVWINNRVLVPDGYPLTSSKVKEAGYEIIILDMSEFRKLDGGLSCLSLRF